MDGRTLNGRPYEPLTRDNLPQVGERVGIDFRERDRVGSRYVSGIVSRVFLVPRITDGRPVGSLDLDTILGREFIAFDLINSINRSFDLASSASALAERWGATMR